MIELSNSTAQTLTSGQSVIFDATILKTGCHETHRRNSSLVNLRGGGTYELHFAANVSGTAAGPVQLTLALDGEPLIETTMISTVGAAGDLNNVATGTLVKTDCGCCTTVSVVNNGTEPVVIGADSSLFIKRVG